MNFEMLCMAFMSYLHTLGLTHYREQTQSWKKTVQHNPLKESVIYHHLRLWISSACRLLCIITFW